MVQIGYYLCLQNGVKKISDRKQRIGHQYLTKALISLYSGEIKNSQKWIKKAQKYDPYAPLFHLLMSETQGKLDAQSETRTHLVRLLDFPETQLFAYKGLIQDDIANNLPEKALERIEILIPNHSDVAWLIEIRLELLARLHYWNKALQTVKLGYKKKIFTQIDTYRMSSVIYCQMAMNSFDNGLYQDAKIWGEKSLTYMHKVKEWSLPACYIILARIYKQAGHIRSFDKILKKSWSDFPHPDIQMLHYTSIDHFEVNKKIDLIHKFIAVFPQNFESQYYLAYAYYKAKIWGQARKILDSLLEKKHTDSRIFSLYADIDRDEFPDHPQERRDAWIARSKHANRPKWQCKSCATHYPVWQAVCDHCHSFSQIGWADYHYVQDQVPTVIGRIKKQPKSEG